MNLHWLTSHLEFDFLLKIKTYIWKKCQECLGMIFIKIIPQLGNTFLISIHPPTSNKFKNSWSINWKMCWVSKFNKFSNIQRLAFQLKLLFYAHIQCASLIFIFLVEKMHSLEDVLFIFGSKIFVIVLHSDWRERGTHSQIPIWNLQLQ